MQLAIDSRHMRFARTLVVRLFIALLIPEAVGGYVAVYSFPLTEAQRQAARLVVSVSLLVGTALVLAVVFAMGSVVGRGLALGPQAGASDRQRAGMAAVHLPLRLTALMLVSGGALVAGLVGLELHLGLALDLALAATGAGTACVIMAAMVGYSVAASAAAPALAELGSFELRGRRTMRGKVLAVCYGLLAVAALLLLSVAYARFRAESDRRYLEKVFSAQKSGEDWIAERGPAAAAELVHLSSGAPTAILSRDGAIVARSGEGIARLLSEGVALGSGTDEVPGGWLVRRTAGATTLVSFLPEAPLRDGRRAFWSQTWSLGLALFVATGLLIWLAAESLTIPIGFLGAAAGRIASGDLTVKPPSVSRDEMGQLAGDFRRMAQGLAALVTDVQAASRGVHDGTREMRDIGERVKGGAREEHERVRGTQAMVEAMRESVSRIGRGVGGLADYVRSTSSAVGEMAAALEEVRRQAAELEGRMEAASADAEKLSGAGRRAQAQLGTLDALAGGAQATLGSVSASLSELETFAVAGQLAAAQAAEMADHAGVVVGEAVSGIESLRSAVGDAKKRVTVLGRRSDDIDHILDFIGEVAGRTNLLSLNASIIATQAGEHGKAFAVVADQIRELAAQISSSTKSVGDIIRAVRDDVSGTARLIDRGDELAAEGVAHARKSLDALHEIRLATSKGHEATTAIRDAVQEHANSMRDVSTLVTSVGDNTDSLSDTIQMVGKSVAAVGSVSRGVGALADEVTRALAEQSGVGRRQLDGMEKMNAMLSDITRALEDHEGATRRVREALSHLGRTAEQHESAVVELSGVAERLGNRSRALAERVDRFKI
jgi:methyl-accepting chemotaxis protein